MTWLLIVVVVIVLPHRKRKPTDGKAIRFDISFQKDGIEKDVEDYGEEITLRFRQSGLPKSN